MEKYLEYFTLDQFRVMKFEDFRENPETEVNSILEWLGLSLMKIDRNVRLASTDATKTRKPLFPALVALATNTPALRVLLQKTFSDRALRRMHRSLSREVEREIVTSEVRQELLERYFLDSIEKTERLLGLDLSDWKNPRA